MTTTEAEIIERVQGFVQENFLYMRPDFALSIDDHLLERGVVDSLGVVEVLAFIESEFGVCAAEEEISESNLGSLRSIARFVTSKQGALARV